MADFEVPAQVAQMAVYSAHEEVMNRRDPKIFDRKQMPLHDFFMSKKKERSFTRGKLIEKVQRDGGGDFQYIKRRTVHKFQETFIDDEMVWKPFRVHLGLESVHADLEDLGVIVMPNENHGKNITTKIPRAASDIIMDYFTQQIEDRENRWDVLTDDLLHLDGTQDALAQPGLDGLLPLVNTTGTIAGKDRADALYRHQAILGLTTGASGTIERGMNTAQRLADENSRGTASAIDAIFAGDDFIDAYVDYMKANGLRYTRDTSDVTGVDIAFPDTKIQWNNIPVVRDPTFRLLDQRGLFTGTPWAKRAYMLSSKTWELSHQKGKDKKFSAPPDPSDQRISRLSWDGRYSIVCWKPNGQAVLTIA